MAETAAAAAQSCLGDPNFAVVCFYLQKFGPHLGLPELNLQQLRSAIDERRLGGGLLRDLHLSLLRKLGRKSVNGGRWEKCVEQFALSCCCIDAWCLSQRGYAELEHADKVLILKNLLEAQFDSNTKFKEKLSEIPSDELRQQPIGFDSDGQAYWFLVDGEMNMSLFRGELEDADGETWRVVSRERDGLAEFIESLKKTAPSGLSAADSKPSQPLDADVRLDNGVATLGNNMAVATASGISPSLTANIKIEPEAACQKIEQTGEPWQVVAANPCADAVDAESPGEAGTAAEEEMSRQTLDSDVKPKTLHTAERNGCTSDSIGKIKEENEGPLLVSECIADSSAVNEDACDAASDCSSDNVPLSQVRKSCRLMTRARAAIAEVKRRRDRDKRKAAKKPQKKQTAKPPAAKKLSRQRRQLSTRKAAGRRPRKSARGSDQQDDETGSEDEDDKQSDYALEDDDDDLLLLESEDSSDADYVPHGRNAQRAARRKAAAGAAATAAVMINDDTPCTRCGEYTHPDLILLCDRCNAGYHTGCLRPPLFVIPDGDWFCPHCQHNMLVARLEAALTDYDAKFKVKQRAVKRQERMANSGISLENIIVSHQERPKRERAHKRERDEDFEYDVEEQAEEEEKKPVGRPSRLAGAGSTVKRSCRTRNKVSYRYEEYDELIKSAIADSCDPQSNGMADGRRADGDQAYCDTRKIGGRRGGGKDIATIMQAEQAAQSHPAPISRGKDMTTILGAASDDESGSGKSSGGDVSSRGSAAKCPPAKPLKKKSKKTRRLTGLDDSASDYEDDDGEEYKATDDDDYEEEEDEAEFDAESLDDDDARSGNSSAGSWCESRYRRSGVRPERRATRSQPARATKTAPRRYTAGLDESGSDGDTTSCRRNRRRASRPASRPASRRVQIADSDNESGGEAEPRRRQKSASSDYSAGSDSAEESTHSREEDEEDYVPQSSRLMNKWNKRTAPVARRATQKKRRRAIVESEDEASASEGKDDEVSADNSPSAGSDRSAESGKSRTGSDVTDDAGSSPDDAVAAVNADEQSAEDALFSTSSSRLPTVTRTEESCGSGSSASPASADSDKRPTLSKSAAKAEVGSAGSPTVPMVPGETRSADRDGATVVSTNATVAMSFSRAGSGSRIAVPGTSVPADHAAELAASSPSSVNDGASVARHALPPGPQQQLSGTGHGYLDRPRSSEASRAESPVTSGWSGSRANLDEVSRPRLVSSPSAYTGNPAVGDVVGPAAYSSAVQQQQNHPYAAAASAAMAGRIAMPHGPRLQGQSAYYGSPLPSQYGGYGQPVTLQSAASSGYGITAMVGPAVGRGPAARQQFPPYAQSYYPGLQHHQQQQHSSLVGDCLPPYSADAPGGYGAMYAVPRQQQLRGYAPSSLVADSDARNASSVHEAAAAGAEALPSVTAASLPREQLSNSHHANFSIASILQPSQQRQKAAAAADENEDELSNILDIASIVTGAPVGEERVHKS